MDLSAYQNINTIIERDSADATYKYALLRGVIEVCQQYSHHRQDDAENESDRVWFPLGLLVEKWILYYYPIFAAPAFVPQKNGEKPDPEPGKKVAFRKYFTPLINYYRDRGGFSCIYNDSSRDLIVIPEKNQHSYCFTYIFIDQRYKLINNSQGQFSSLSDQIKQTSK